MEMAMMKLPKHTEAVIFDLDGTLVDSMGMWKEIDVDFLGRFGYTVPENLQKEIEGMSFSETAAYFQNRFSLPMSLDKIKACWNEMAMEQYSNKIRLKPGAEDFLKSLKQKQIRTGIATSNSRELVEAVTGANGVRDLFDAVVVGCQVPKGKPSPDVYLFAAEKISVLPEHCLVLEDLPAGNLAGNRAGMTVWAVDDEYSRTMRMEKEELADGFLTSYAEIELEA